MNPAILTGQAKTQTYAIRFTYLQKQAVNHAIKKIKSAK